jgi:hypothetical protein
MELWEELNAMNLEIFKPKDNKILVGPLEVEVVPFGESSLELL